MKNRYDRLTHSLTAAATVGTLLVLGLAATVTTITTTTPRGRLDQAGRRDRGALSLEQAILTAVLSAAGIALGVVIVNAILTHQNNIR